MTAKPWPDTSTPLLFCSRMVWNCFRRRATSHRSLFRNQVASHSFASSKDHRNRSATFSRPAPKWTGLWVCLRFRDGDVLEGIIPNNLMQMEPCGFSVIPPDSFGNQQRVWVPRLSLAAVEVLGVVGSPLQKRKAKPRRARTDRPASTDRCLNPAYVLLVYWSLILFSLEVFYEVSQPGCCCGRSLPAWL